MIFACSRNEFVLFESSHEQSDGDAEEVILGSSFRIGVGGGAMFRSSTGSAASLETRTRCATKRPLMMDCRIHIRQSTSSESATAIALIRLKQVLGNIALLQSTNMD